MRVRSRFDLLDQERAQLVVVLCLSDRGRVVVVHTDDVPIFYDYEFPIVLLDQLILEWWYSIVAVFAIVAIVLLGLIVEGLAGLVEYAFTRHLKRPSAEGQPKRGQVRKWYKAVTDLPDEWGPGQRWMWQSTQAAEEFARRRMRILVSRNTAFLIPVAMLVFGVALLVRKPADWGVWLFIDVIASLALFAVFVWLWIRANLGWHEAVRDASKIGVPS